MATANAMPVNMLSKLNTPEELLVSAEGGETHDQILLGEIYIERGDCAEGVKWYRKAAETGNIDSQMSFGERLLFSPGLECVQDRISEAAKWYMKAATKGNLEAQYMLGEIYSRPEKRIHNARRAAKWYRKAAELGHVLSQVKLGRMYVNGCGVSKNYREALRWYRKAAAQEDGEAEFLIGTMYLEGKGSAKNYGRAAYWIRLAAYQDYHKAQLILGTMYEAGNGVPQDHIQAYNWYALAYRNGMKEACNYRNKIAKKMTQEEIESAERLVRNWRAPGNTIYQKD